MNRHFFKTEKIMEQGTDNPIVNRLVLQFNDIFRTNLIKLPEQRIEKINQILFECMKDLLRAEEFYNKFIEIETTAVNKAVNEDSHKYVNPSIELTKYFEDFLIRCVIVLRRTTKIGEVVFNKKFEGPKKLLSFLTTILKPEDPFFKMLEKDRVWYKELYDIRGKVEHSELEISNFNVFLNEAGEVIIEAPIIVEKQCTLREYMRVTLYNVFTYCEDFTVLLLQTCCHEACHIVQVPSGAAQDHRGFKYIIDLKDDIKKKIPGFIPGRS